MGEDTDRAALAVGVDTDRAALPVGVIYTHGESLLSPWV